MEYHQPHDTPNNGGSVWSYSVWALAVHPETPHDVLTKLASAHNHAIVERVAEHANASPDLLIDLAAHPSIDVRTAVGQNENTPFEWILKLAQDESADVRYGIAENAHTPIEILTLLLDDVNPYVAHRAQKTCARLQQKSATVTEMVPRDQRRAEFG